MLLHYPVAETLMLGLGDRIYRRIYGAENAFCSPPLQLRNLEKRTAGTHYLLNNVGLVLL